MKCKHAKLLKKGHYKRTGKTRSKRMKYQTVMKIKDDLGFLVARVVKQRYPKPADPQSVLFLMTDTDIQQFVKGAQETFREFALRVSRAYVRPSISEVNAL